MPPMQSSTWSGSESCRHRCTAYASRLGPAGASPYACSRMKPSAKRHERAAPARLFHSTLTARGPRAQASGSGFSSVGATDLPATLAAAAPHRAAARRHAQAIRTETSTATVGKPLASAYVSPALGHECERREVEAGDADDQPQGRGHAGQRGRRGDRNGAPAGALRSAVPLSQAAPATTAAAHTASNSTRWSESVQRSSRKVREKPREPRCAFAAMVADHAALAHDDQQLGSVPMVKPATAAPSKTYTVTRRPVQRRGGGLAAFPGLVAVHRDASGTAGPGARLCARHRLHPRGRDGRTSL